MKKTLVLSTMLFGAMSLMFTGCAKEDGGDEDGASTNASGDGDEDPSTTEDTNDTDTDGMTTGETGGSGEETDGQSTGVFVPDTDIGTVSECDPFAQDCPDGEKCVPYGSTGGNWDANKCVPVTGDGQAGDQCSYGGVVEATDDCNDTTHCWDVMDVDGMNVGVCTEFCTGSADDPLCPPDTSCLIANEGSINMCITTCDPLLQECGSGLACFWANGNFNCIFTTQDIPLGEPCGFINDCVTGTACLTAEVMPDCNGSACCGSFCDLDDPVCPQEGTECGPFFEEGQEPPGYEGVGVCILPGA
jgi:hypothetical protein